MLRSHISYSLIHAARQDCLKLGLEAVGDLRKLRQSFPDLQAFQARGNSSTALDLSDLDTPNQGVP